MKFAFNVAKSACGKKPVTLIADCMLSKLDKQKKNEGDYQSLPGKDMTVFLLRRKFCQIC